MQLSKIAGDHANRPGSTGKTGSILMNDGWKDGRLRDTR